jgi:hypothetical protein
MEVNFKYEVGELVRAAGNPLIKMMVLKRIFDQCVGGVQIQYHVRQIVSDPIPQLARDPIAVFEFELEKQE